MSAWDHAYRSDVARAIAAAFLATAWNPGALRRAATAITGRRRWANDIVGAVSAAYRDRPADRPRELARFVEHQLAELARSGRLRRLPQVRHLHTFEQAMGLAPWSVPPIESVGKLAAFLDLRIGELEWLADRRGLERSVEVEQLRNYRYSFQPRRGAPPRVIERPKRLLKEVQRRVLHQILDVVPPHADAQGFRRGHSVVTHARRHVNQHVVLRFDLEDFFGSIDGGRVYGIFRTAGYPESVAYTLTALCTNTIPSVEWERLRRPKDPSLLAAHRRLEQKLSSPHLPQGAPTSPALANLVAFGMDRRLAALAARIGAFYSRYADDLALSGGRWLVAHSADVRRLVVEIVRAEGFRANEHKSQVLSRAGRQQLCGVVVNVHPNVPRKEFDRLKAILHDAVRNGPSAANRAGAKDFHAHLLGRISWVELVNPARGGKPRRRFESIDWNRGDQGGPR